MVLVMVLIIIYFNNYFKGISRLERFERAEKFNLNPPKEILEYINNDHNQQSLFNSHNI